MQDRANPINDELKTGNVAIWEPAVCSVSSDILGQVSTLLQQIAHGYIGAAPMLHDLYSPCTETVPVWMLLGI